MKGFRRSAIEPVAVQDVEAALAAPQQQLADCRADFASLLAYFGENAAAAQKDTEFWQDTLVAFVRALSAAQHAATRQQQVVSCSICAHHLNCLCCCQLLARQDQHPPEPASTCASAA